MLDLRHWTLAFLVSGMMAIERHLIGESDILV